MCSLCVCVVAIPTKKKTGGGSGDKDMDMDMPGMMMYFHQRIPEIVLFEFWTIGDG